MKDSIKFALDSRSKWYWTQSIEIIILFGPWKIPWFQLWVTTWLESFNNSLLGCVPFDLNPLYVVSLDLFPKKKCGQRCGYICEVDSLKILGHRWNVWKKTNWFLLYLSHIISWRYISSDAKQYGVWSMKMQQSFTSLRNRYEFTMKKPV